MRDTNVNYDSNPDHKAPEIIVAAVSGGLTASEILGKPSFWMMLKNYFGVPNCEYSHDSGLVAAVRDVQITKMMNTGRAAQAGHQSTKDGAKSFKQAGPTIQRQPNNPDGAPTISPLTH